MIGLLGGSGGRPHGDVQEGKATISRELAAVFDRLGTNAEAWQARLLKLRAGRLLGRYFAASRKRLREAAERPGVRHLANLAGCPTQRSSIPGAGADCHLIGPTTPRAWVPPDRSEGEEEILASSMA